MLGGEAPWLAKFLKPLPQTAEILDLGCGSGRPIAAHLIGLGHILTGVDASPQLLAMARDMAPRQRWIAADMRRLVLGRRFDGVLAWDSFFHLTHADQRAMFAVFTAHVEPGGTLMFTSGPAHGIAMGTMFGEALFHASLGPQEYRQHLDAHGFEVLEHVAEDPDCGGHTVWLAQRRATRPSGQEE
ncbi:MAG: methyltransferase [Rhodospirillales bacterium]|nr:methyltransferase [Rhodospirillales bacterium]